MVLLVFLCDDAQAVLSGQSITKLSQLAQFDQVSITQLENKRQSKTLQILPFPQALPVFFPGNRKKF